MNSRVLLGISFVVAGLLAIAIVYPGALTKPYSGDSDPYAVAHESSEAFDETIEEAGLDTNAATPVADLTENQRRVFEAAKEQPPTEYDTVTSGWQSLGTIPVCDDVLLVCDEYEDAPDFYQNRYTLVEDTTGDLYIVRVDYWGADWDVDRIAEFVAKLLIFGPYALFLAYRGWTFGPPDPTRSAVGYGAALVAVVFAYPYVLMFTGVSLPPWHLPLLAVVTWAVILAEILRSRVEKPVETRAS